MLRRSPHFTRKTLPPLAPTASGFTRLTGVPLYWVRYGPPGAPQLLVLHGGPGAHHDYLLPQMLRLAESHEVVLYDQRGGGRSRTDDRTPITWRTHVEDLALLAGQLGLDPLTIVGYSFGGLLALLYAIEVAAGRASGPHPERLVLIDPAALTIGYRRQFEAEFARRQRSPEVLALREELAASELEPNSEAYRRRAFELGVAGYFADPRRACELTPFRVIGRVQDSVWESLGDYDVISQLPAVRARTLIVHGRQDPIPLASSEAAARALPSARLVVLERSGHVPYVEAADTLFEAVGDFLAEPGPGTLSLGAMPQSNETAQPHIASISINGRRYHVSVRVSYDGVEYLGRLWFADEDPNRPGIPDRGVLPGRSKEEVLDLAYRLTEDEIRARYRRAVANRRRYLALRSVTDEMLRKVRYLNQVAISMRAGLIDIDGAAQEIDLTEQQMHELVRRLRSTAGVEEESV